MTRDEAAEEYAQAMLNREIEHCRQTRPERLSMLTEQMKADYLAKMKEQAVARMAEFDDGEKMLKHYRIGTLHPSNKNTRKLFEAVSGIRLPAGATASKEAVRKWIGPEIVDAYFARLEKERADEEAAEKQAALEDWTSRIEAAKAKMLDDKPISGESLIEVARSLGIEVHPRTAGMVYKRIVEISRLSARQYGKGNIDSAFALYRDTLAALKEQAVPA